MDATVMGPIIIILVGAIGFAAWAFAGRVIRNDEALYNARNSRGTTRTSSK